MAGIKKLRKIQLGRETTAGTEADATILWRGTGTIEDLTELVFRDDDVGYISALNESYISKDGGQLEMDEVDATFEQLQHIFEASVSTGAVTTAAPWVWTYPLPTTAQPTICTYTVEGGDNQQEEQFLYGFVEKFTLSGEAGGPVNIGATWLGKTVAKGTYTSALSVPTVEGILFQLGKLYIDPTTGNFGATQKTNTWLDFSMEYDSGWRAVYTGDGSLAFSFLKNVGPSIALDVTFEHDTTGVAEKDAWRAKTGRLIEMLFEGTALSTTSTAYSKKTLKIDLAGSWEKFDKIDEKDGNDIVKGTFKSLYDPTKGAWGSIYVANETSAL